MAHDVFISYSNRDKPTADAVCATLEARGIRCWIAPRDIRSGSDWGEAIIDAISASRAMVLVFSSNANQAQEFIKREVGCAVDRSVPIVPFRIEEVRPARSLEFFLGSVHWLDALTPPLEAHLERLGDTVAALVNAEGGGDERDRARHGDERKDHERDRRGQDRGGSTGTNRITVAAGALAVVALVAIAWLLLRPVPRHDRIENAGTADEVRAPNIDERLAGTWHTQVVANSVPFTMTFVVGPDGDYTTTAVTEDAGTFEARAGRWSMTSSATRQRTDGTYRMPAPDRLAMTGPLGTTEWTRGDAPKGDAQDHELVGTWRTRFARDGLDWTGDLALPPSGRAAASYRVRFTSEERGQMLAATNRWRTTTKAGKITNGIYQFVDADTVSMTGPVGVAVWKRAAR